MLFLRFASGSIPGTILMTTKIKNKCSIYQFAG
nr:MAG TPA: hypothetical protein [Caudoviricetes sp.]